MKNALLVEIFDAFGDLVDNGDGLFLGHEAPLAQLGLQIALGGELQEEIDVVGCFRKISKLNDVLVRDGLPSIHLVLEGSDEILLRQGLVLAGVDFVNQMLLGDHLAGQLLPIGVVDRQVSFSKAPLS